LGESIQTAMFCYHIEKEVESMLCLIALGDHFVHCGFRYSATFFTASGNLVASIKAMYPMLLIPISWKALLLSATFSSSFVNG
jgi:hypothetical protein